MNFKDYLTTGQIAKLLGVAPRKACAMIDDGHIEGYRIPGSNDRRVPLENVLAIARRLQLPRAVSQLEAAAASLGVLTNALPTLLIIGRDIIPPEPFTGFQVSQAVDCFHSGQLVTQSSFRAVLVCGSLGNSIVTTLADRLRNLHRQKMTLSLLAPEDWILPAHWQAHGFELLWKQPICLSLVATELLNYLGSQKKPTVTLGRRKKSGRKRAG